MAIYGPLGVLNRLHVLKQIYAHGFPTKIILPTHVALIHLSQHI